QTIRQRMTKQHNELRAGLFILVAVALILAVIFSIRGISEWADPTRELRVRFNLDDDIGGLRIGDEVRIGGYKVGTVTNIALSQVDDPPGGNTELELTIDVPQRYIIHADAVVRVQSSFTGVSVLNFESLGSDRPLAEGGALRGRPGMLTELAAMMTDAAPRVDEILVNVRDASAHVRDVTQNVKTQTLPRADDALGSVARAADAAQTLMHTANVQIDPEREQTIGHTARGMMA